MSVETRVKEPRDHVVQFYETDEELVDTVSSYLGDGLRAGDVAMVVATAAHMLAFHAAMAASGIDLAEARASGRLITLDATQTLSRFMAGDGPDADAFDAVLGNLVRQASHSGRGIRAYGEMVALLWDAGDVTAAIELESLWNDLGLQVPFSLFCAYPARSVAGAQHADALHEVCHLHSAIVGPPAPRPGATEATRQFAHGLHAPRAARRFVLETLERWGREEFVDDAATVVTELATNAVVHAESDFIVAMSSCADGVRISVRDASPALPILRDSSSTATTGRGIALVAAVASRWGIDLDGEGKAVWAELS